MLFSAVSVLVVAQSSSEIPEGLTNNPVYRTLIWNAHYHASSFPVVFLIPCSKMPEWYPKLFHDPFRPNFASSFLGAFEKMEKTDYQYCHVCIAVSPQGTARFQLDGFSLNFIFEGLKKICRENSSELKFRQEKQVLYMKNNLHFFLS